MRSEFRRFLLISSTALALSLPVSADTLFDNSTADLKYRFNPGTSEVGDEIYLSHVGFLTNFTFEYYGTNTAAAGNPLFSGGTVEAQVQIYLMDGPLFNGFNTPGTPLYTSGWSAITPPEEGRATLSYSLGIDFTGAGILIPSTNITWSVQFRGMGETDDVGVDIYSPPTVGQDFPDYWRNTGTGWALETNSAVSAVDFAARFQGTIPEPSVFALGVVGGLVMLVAGRKRKV